MKVLFKTLVLFCFFFWLATQTAFAYSIHPSEQLKRFEDQVYKSQDQVNPPSYTLDNFNNLIMSINQNIMGSRDYPEQSGLGAIGTIGGLVAGIYANPPVSSVEYFADLGHSFGIKSAHAQGIGFSGLKPVLTLWKTFRNIAYILFVLVFIWTGLAIMFRVKIDPKTIISIQNAIPKFIIALILVTFSYAIAGLLVDLVYVLLFLLVSTFISAMKLPGIEKITSSLLEAGGGWGNIMNAAVLLILLALNSITKLFLVFPVLAFAPVTLIFGILLLWTLIRIFFALLGAYVRVVIGVVFGPLWLSLSAIPGNASAGSWFRYLLSNLSVLPATFGAILLSGYFLSYDIPVISNAVFDPVQAIKSIFSTVSSGISSGKAFTLSSAISSITSFVTVPITALIGIGIFFLTPKVADIVRAALSKKPFPYGTAIGEAFGPIKGPVSTVTGGVKKGGIDLISQQVTLKKLGKDVKGAARTGETQPEAIDENASDYPSV